jgi:hypothetical protein
MKTPLLFAIMVLLLSSAQAAAGEAAKGRESLLLVHVTAPLDRNNDRTALVFRMVAAALTKGHQVVLLFDAEGVSSLKRTPQRPRRRHGSGPSGGKARSPEALRQ